MLRVFRENLKYLSWILWLVILVFVVFLFTDFGAINPGGGVGATAAAKVGDYEISYADFQDAYRRQEAQIAQAYGGQLDSETARQIGLPAQVMDFLVAEKILLAEADRMGIRVSDEEVREQILSFPVFQDADGNFVGEEAYQSLLRNNRLTASAFETSVREDIVSQRVRNILNQNIYVSDEEVEASYRETAERARIRFVRLSGSDFTDQVTLDAAEVSEYFASNRLDFEIPEQRVADYLLVRPDDLIATIEVTDEEIASYYRENEADYTRDEQVKARHILARTGDDRSLQQAKEVIATARRRLASGESFAAVASELSDDPGSKDNGGDLGFFGRNQMVGPFEEAAFGAAPGDIVGPVETSFGVHLIEVLDRTEGGVQPLDQVSTGIRSRLAAERARTLAETKATELSERIEREELSEPDALRTLAETEAGVSFATTPPFGEDGAALSLRGGGALARAAFDLEVGNVSAPIRMPNGWSIVRLSEVQAERTPELAEVEDDVRTALRSSKETTLALAALEEARRQISAGSTFDEVASGLDTEIVESDEFGVTGGIGQLGNHPGVAKAALELDAGEIGGPISSGGQAILFEVTERKRFDAASFEEQRESTRQGLVAERAAETLMSLVEARREELGVIYDPNFLETFGSPGR